MDEWNEFPFADWNSDVDFGDGNNEPEDPNPAANEGSSSLPEDPAPLPALPPIPAALEETKSPLEDQDVIVLPPLKLRSALNPDMPRLFLQKNMVKVPGKKLYKAQYSIDYSKNEEKFVVDHSLKKQEPKKAACQRTVSIPWEHKIHWKCGKKKNKKDENLPKRKENKGMGLYPPPEEQPSCQEYSTLAQDYWYQYEEQNYGNTAYVPEQQANWVPTAGYSIKFQYDDYVSDCYYPSYYYNYHQTNQTWQDEAAPNPRHGIVTNELPILTDLSGVLSPEPELMHQPYPLPADSLAPAACNNIERPVNDVATSQDEYFDNSLCPAPEIRPELLNNSVPVQMAPQTFPLHHMDSPSRPMSLPNPPIGQNSPPWPPISPPQAFSLPPLENSPSPFDSPSQFSQSPVTVGSTINSTPKALTVPEVVENIYKSVAMFKDQNRFHGTLTAGAPNVDRDAPHFKSKDQKAYLEVCFQENQRPTTLELELISAKLDLSLKQVRNWFYNRRAKVNKGPFVRPEQPAYV